jgi:hypothetical protein
MDKYEEADREHRFSVGQRVSLSATRFEKLPLAGTFEIMALLPAKDGERQYRVKHDREAFERMVGEGRLTPAT